MISAAGRGIRTAAAVTAAGAFFRLFIFNKIYDYRCHHCNKNYQNYCSTYHAAHNYPPLYLSVLLCFYLFRSFDLDFQLVSLFVRSYKHIDHKRDHCKSEDKSDYVDLNSACEERSDLVYAE